MMLNAFPAWLHETRPPAPELTDYWARCRRNSMRARLGYRDWLAQTCGYRPGTPTITEVDYDWYEEKSA